MQERWMLQKYREIFYGVAFGFGAACLDTFIDARIGENSFWDEVTAHPSMMLYRAIFLLFGLAIGWQVWRNKRRERDFRHMVEVAERFHQDCGKQALLIYTKIQVLLTRDDLHLQPNAQELVQAVYRQAQELQTLVREKMK
jgi:hypothetical protein